MYEIYQVLDLHDLLDKISHWAEITEKCDIFLLLTLFEVIFAQFAVCCFNNTQKLCKTTLTI